MLKRLPNIIRKVIKTLPNNLVYMFEFVTISSKIILKND